MPGEVGGARLRLSRPRVHKLDAALDSDGGRSTVWAERQRVVSRFDLECAGLSATT